MIFHTSFQVYVFQNGIYGTVLLYICPFTTSISREVRMPIHRGHPVTKEWPIIHKELDTIPLKTNVYVLKLCALITQALVGQTFFGLLAGMLQIGLPLFCQLCIILALSVAMRVKNATLLKT